MITSKHHSAMIQNIFSNHNVLCKAVLSKIVFTSPGAWTHDQNKDFIVEKVKKMIMMMMAHVYIQECV